MGFVDFTLNNEQSNGIRKWKLGLCTGLLGSAVACTAKPEV